jgi:hypothetical protein
MRDSSLYIILARESVIHFHLACLIYSCRGGILATPSNLGCAYFSRMATSGSAPLTGAPVESGIDTTRRYAACIDRTHSWIEDTGKREASSSEGG